mgnify:CR=1 FL=1
MKRPRVILLVCSIVLQAAFAIAAPVLVAVDMDNIGEIRTWRSLNIPTYEFIGQTAIAEIDDAALGTLPAQGFSIRVIDASPWTENYFIGNIHEPEAALPGEVILATGSTRLVKSATATFTDFMELGLEFRRLGKSILPARFWEKITTKTVPLRELEYDPFIQGLVNQVSGDSLASYTQRLQNFQTRLTFSDSGFAASEWIRQKFISFGYPAEFDSVYLGPRPVYNTWPDTGYERNVVARIQGTYDPERIFIICGHHDAIIWPDTQSSWIFAPGADDNGSAIAAVCEAARIFHGQTWEPSIEFITWAAEEVGLLGSDDYARRADSLDLDIAGVIDLDMIGWTNQGLLNCNIHYTQGFCLWLVDLFVQAGQIYAPELTYFEEFLSAGSDNRSFSLRGFPAIWGAERWYNQNPNWHRPTDILANITPAMHLGATKAAVATLAILGVHPGPVDGIAITDFGTGSSLRVSWSQSPYGDVVGYRVYYGLQSEVYTDSHYVSGLANTVDTLTGLVTDSTYYVTVRAIDNNDRLSYLAYEVTGVPRLLPLAPAGIIATPVSGGIRVDWRPNDELDLAGYRLYRRLNEDPVYDSLNIALLTDTTYTDPGLSGANRYYYVLRAFDDAGNGSAYSLEAYGRPITLDQGVFVVDETRNGDNPPDSLQDAFYAFVMDNYAADVYEYDSIVHAPVLADFVPYSSMVWFADDYIENFASDHVADLQTYLDLGGNIWFAGWRPTANLAGQTTYPFSFASGSFMYDYFRLSNVAITAVTDSFQAADGLLGYPRLEVDPAKVPYASWNGVLRYIEALTPGSGGEAIYTMDMRNNASPYEGAVCAVRYLAGGHKAVFFGFPLYFMDQDDARSAALQVMADFGEVGIAETPKSIGVADRILLQQNIPNPFVDQTVISYQIMYSGNVCLKVYNIAGQLVRTLVNGDQEPGVYDIVWSGLDDQGQHVPNGIYFCRLESQDNTAITKMTVMR